MSKKNKHSSNRKEELLQKGVNNLSTDEREELANSISNEETLFPETSSEPKAPQDQEVVTMTKGELKGLIGEYVQQALGNAKSEARSLQKEIGLGDWKEYKAPEKKNKTARMRLYREDTDQEFGLIIDWKFLKNEYNEDTRKKDIPVYKLTILKGEEKEFINLPLKEFTKINDFETVEILHIDEKVLEKSDGKVRVPRRDKGGYVFSRAVDGIHLGDLTNEEVSLKVFRKRRICTIKRPNGQTLKINSNRLNA